MINVVWGEYYVTTRYGGILESRSDYEGGRQIVTQNSKVISL